jgi:hypothetical protein
MKFREINHNYEVRFTIYDLFEILMYSKKVREKTEKIELDVSSWNSGIYMARDLFMNEVVATAKFVVQK